MLFNFTRNLRLLLLIIFSVFITSSFAIDSGVYEGKTVNSILIQVKNLPLDSSFNTRSVTSLLKTHQGDPFSQTTFDADLKSLANEYDKIEPSISSKNDKLDITLKIWLKPTIRQIYWYGNNKVSTSSLQRELGIKPGSVFDRNNFSTGINKVRDFYVKKGFFASQVDYDTAVDNSKNELYVEINITESKCGEIGDIILEGFTSEEKRKIREAMFTKKYNLFTSWMTGTGKFHEDMFEQDKLVIVDTLQNEGYADAKIYSKIEDVPNSSKINLYIGVDKGEIYHFNEVTFVGNTVFTDKVVEQHFLVHPGDIYSPEKLRNTAQSIKSLYGRKGYIDANVDFETELIHDKPLYNAHFQIEEGIEYKIGLIHVFGNVQTRTNVILRESLLTPGETFDSARLEATQRRLENIGYFKNVNVYAVRTKEGQSLGDEYRDVYIEVEEKPTGSASLSMGFSSAENIFGGLDFTETNFDHRGLYRMFSNGLSSLRGGGEYAHAKVNIGKRERTYSLSWLDPYFRDSHWRIGFDAVQSHSNLQAKDRDIDTTGLTTHASYPLNAYWAFSTRYKIRYIDVDAPSGGEDEFKDIDFDNLEISDNEKIPDQDQNTSGIISAVGVGLSFDSTNSMVKPSKGFRSSFDVEYTGIGGDYYFLRLSYINTFYTPLWKSAVMKYRADFKFIEPLGRTDTALQIPYNERFFLGGEGSVRGYVPYSLGPHYEGGDPTGGISASLLSIELMQEIFNPVDIFGFVDAGYVSLQHFHIGEYNMSYGFGVRVEMMNRVPITVGIGFPVNSAFHEQERKFFFSMGAQF